MMNYKFSEERKKNRLRRLGQATGACDFRNSLKDILVGQLET